MQITKREFIEKLYEIEEKENLKLGKEVQRVVRNDIIPIDIIKLINKYDKSFLKIYDTYNVIYLARNKNPLYRNLKNLNLPIEEKAVAISSLLTKILISCSKIADVNERLAFAKVMDVEGLTSALNLYAVNNETEELERYFNQVNNLLKILYSENKEVEKL